MQNKLLLPLMLMSASVLAHDGHGAPALHLHDGDRAALTLLAAAAGAAVWWLAKGRK